MTHALIPLESRGAWNDALQDIPHSFAHTWENCRAMYLTTGYPTYLYCFESAHRRIACPIAEREINGSSDIVTPYGFSGFVGTGDCVDFPRYWLEFVQSRGYVSGYIALNPAFENSTYFPPQDAFCSNTLFYLDLTLGTDQLLADVASGRRRQLSGPRLQAISFVEDRGALTEFLLANHGPFMERVNGSAASRFSTETLAFLCRLENVLLIGAAGQQGIEAAVLFACTNFAAEGLISVPLPNGRKHMAALVWRAVEQLKRLQVPLLNLGGGIREDDSVAAFKRRFGGREMPFRCLKQIYNPDVYSALCGQVEADPRDKSGYFPAYRRPPSRET
jgi:hypothetical protein